MGIGNNTVTRYHIIGIAGAGMSAIANLLLDQGHQVSGSDLSQNHLTAALSARGAVIHHGHAPDYVRGAEVVLATAAAAPDHVELRAAAAAGIPCLRRDDLWREWSRTRPIIAVAGSHGKTTTTAMIAWLLHAAGREPGFLIGSDAPNLGTNARWGNPHAPLVIEADEYDRAFLALTPIIAVVTNVEWDHPDIYPTAEQYHAAFSDFAMQTQGVIVTCGDGGLGAWHTAAAANDMPFLTYGLDRANHYQAVLDIEPSADPAILTRATVQHPKPSEPLVYATNSVAAPFSPDLPAPILELGVPGLHNLRNALAALVVADLYGVARDTAIAALRTFRGTARRFELVGVAGAITVIDDYAHHPTEVHATLQAARTRYPAPQRIVAYVQPHTYSRTRSLLEQWAGAFEYADLVLVGDVYPSREREPEGTAHALAAMLAAQIGQQHPAVQTVGDPAQAAITISALLRPNDVLVAMGAGDSTHVAAQVFRTVQQQASEVRG